MYKKAAVLLIALSGLMVAAAPPSQPVYIVLYSRFYDHSHQHTTDERLQRLLPLLTRLQKEYPQSGVSALFQFSGTVSEVLEEENGGLHLVDQLKDASRKGLVDIGYTGEEEPSYLYRPKPNLMMADTPEARWAAKAEAAERFLTDFKNPVTGLPVPGLSGGLKRTQEVFGPVAFVSGISALLGGDSAGTNELRKLSPNAMATGIPAPDPRRGIEGFGFSAAQFSKFMSPDSFDSPEVFWEDNVLRLSDASLTDYRPHSTDENLDSLKKAFQKLDRSHIRVIKLEVASYKRYLTRRADGSVVIDPMEWMYYHPDDPKIPTNMKPLVPQSAVEAGYANDEATLKWLLNDFLPANPGSRFISVHELAALSAPVGSEVSAADLGALASDIDGRFVKMPMTAPDFGQVGNNYFTLAESFDLFAQALASLSKTGSLPKAVPFVTQYGPLTLPNDMGAMTGSVAVSDVLKTASQIAPRLRNAAWKRVPDNSAPGLIDIGTLHLNAAQFLRLMAQAYLDPSPSKILKVNAVTLSTRAGFMFPKNTLMTDQSNSWTYKPAPLHFGGASPVAAAGAQ
jgi:hypothetical protein